MGGTTRLCRRKVSIHSRVEIILKNADTALIFENVNDTSSDSFPVQHANLSKVSRPVFTVLLQLELKASRTQTYLQSAEECSGRTP